MRIVGDSNRGKNEEEEVHLTEKEVAAFADSFLF